MEKQTNKKKKTVILLYIITIILLILWSIRLDLINMDNIFTLRMIQHPFSEIIKLDSMDVHPPLYYIILKIFFNITFISHASPFVQVVAGRLLNVLFFMVTLIVMRSILNKTIHQQYSFLFLLLVSLFPTVIWQSTGIRMYSLSALFIACELNSIINYNRNKRLKDIILATVFASLGAWTHYFTEIISGLLLFYNFVGEKHKRIPYLISGIAFFISFVPWLQISMNQVRSVEHSYWIKNQIAEYFNVFMYQKLGELLNDKASMCFTILFLICLMYITFKTLKSFNAEFKKYYVMIAMVLLGTIVLGFVLSVIIRPIFQERYVYGVSLIYFIMTLPLIKKFVSTKLTNGADRIIKGCLFLLIGIGTTLNLALGVFYNLKEIKIYNTIRTIECSDSKVVKGNNDETTLLGDSFFVQDKIFTTKNYNKINHSCQSKELFESIYPNIKDN